MTEPADEEVLGPKLIQTLTLPSAYRDESVHSVELIETHISWVFLTDRHAYKIKKSMSNEFIDYSTLERRLQMCRREVELDRRYAPNLYLDVVPITRGENGFEVGGEGEVCEYAVKMHRFPSDALLAQRLSQNRVRPAEIKDLARRIADFHMQAQPTAMDFPYGDPATIRSDALQNLDAIENASLEFGAQHDPSLLSDLRTWTEHEFIENETRFRQRKESGWVRECHGDLHAGNIVSFQGQFTPFDGIEFNDNFRWIDVLSDFAFLAMDVSVRGQLELSNLLISTYFETTGDYASLPVLRWYMVYRALVRAKVSNIVMSQHSFASEAFASASSEQRKLLALAWDLGRTSIPKLWITHGLSGSGKSTGAEQYVQREGAIRLRADVERKRLAGLGAHERNKHAFDPSLYSADMSQRTYDRLFESAQQVLDGGRSVVVDATFLKRFQRKRFADLATRRKIPFQILDFHADIPTLSLRMAARQRRGDDPSDATSEVLAWQLEQDEPFDEAERAVSVAASAAMS